MEPVRSAGDPQGTRAALERLDSWKEIAAYLKRDVSTVQRWEKKGGLPVHRHVHGKQGAIYAYNTELDAWWRNERGKLLDESTGERSKHRLYWAGVAIAAGTVLIVLGSAAVLWLGKSGGTKTVGQTETIAVLPFQNLTGDAERDFFADGMTDQVITYLGRTGDLRVISRTSAMTYKGTHKLLPQIAQELHADVLVEGAIARSSGRVRITAQLISAATDRHLWASSYDSDLPDVLSLQDDVAGRIAAEVEKRLVLGHPVSAVSEHPVNPRAREAYLKGRYFWDKRTSESLEKAITYFDEAIEKDPSYAASFAGLADSYNLLSVWGTLDPREAFPMAKAAALKALQLDKNLAEAHTSLAFASYRFFWDWPGAEKEFREALRSNPNYATGHQWFGEFLADMGRFDQGIAELEYAKRLDPLSLIIRCDLAAAYVHARSYTLAIGELKTVLQLDPNYIRARLYLGSAYEATGDNTSAEIEFKRLAVLTGNDEFLQVLRAKGYARSGNKVKAREVIEGLLGHAKEGRFGSFQIASLYAGIQETEEALRWLQKGYD